MPPDRIASSLLDAIRVVCPVHTGTVQYLDDDGELMWLVDESDERHWWKVASPDLYEAVYTLGEMLGVDWEDG